MNEKIFNTLTEARKEKDKKNLLQKTKNVFKYCIRWIAEMEQLMQLYTKSNMKQQICEVIISH